MAAAASSWPASGIAAGRRASMIAASRRSAPASDANTRASGVVTIGGISNALFGACPQPAAIVPVKSATPAAAFNALRWMSCFDGRVIRVDYRAPLDGESVLIVRCYTVESNNVLDLDSVRCFLAAAHKDSFRAAAAVVHLSPAAFGERLKRLEDDLGAPLFERTTRVVRLTAAGERFLPAAEALLAEALRAREAVLDPLRIAPFALLIGTRYELGMSWLVPNLGRLEATRPERTVHLYFGDSSDLLRRLERSEIDAFVSSVRVSDVGLAYAPLHDETYVFVGATRYVKQTPLRSAADAGRHILIDAHPDLPLFRYFLDTVPPEPAWTFARISRMGTIAAIRRRVLDGAGVAVLPEYFVTRDLAAGRMTRLMPKTRLRKDVFRLIWRAGHARERELRRLAEELRGFALR